jgi:curved DNA-binding protein CbpA
MAEAEIVLDDEYKDHLYAVLNLPRNADVDDIQRNFKILSRAFHPDKSISFQSETANAVFVAVKNAADVLSDPVFRLAYDHGSLIAVNLIKRLQSVSQSQKIRNDSADETNVDIYEGIKNAKTETEAINMIQEMLDSYESQRNRTGKQQFEASCDVSSLYRDSLHLCRESSLINLQTREQVSNRCGVNIGVSSEVNHLAESNIGLSAGVDYQPVNGTHVAADLIAKHRSSLMASIRSSRKTASGTILTSAIGGGLKRKQPWNVSFSSIRALSFGRDDGSPEAQKIHASWSLAFSSTRLRSVVLSLKNSNFPVWRCRLGLSPYPVKFSWRGDETDTFYTAISCSLVAFRVKILRICSINNVWTLKYGLKYDGLSLLTGGSLWTMLCCFESAHLSLSFPMTIHDLSPASWLIALLAVDLVDHQLAPFRARFDVPDSLENEVQGRDVAIDSFFPEVIANIASKKRKQESMQEGLVILSAKRHCGRDQQDITDILQFCVVDSRIELRREDPRLSWQMPVRLDNRTNFQGWKWLFGSGSQVEETRVSELHIRYQFQGKTYELTISGSDAIELPHPSATELGVSYRVS